MAWRLHTPLSRKYLDAQQAGCPFDAVILDITIRDGMGGEETLKHLLEKDPQVKAIVSSGYSDDSAIASYERQGFKEVLLKPYTIEELNSVLDRLMR